MASLKLSDKIDIFLGVSLQIVIVIFLGRFTIDIGTRIVYPFIPQISEGLGISLTAFSVLIAIRTFAGMSSLLFGILADRYGRRKVMAIGLFCQALGVAGLAFFGRSGATFSMIIFGLALAAFIPAQQAYISDLVHYEKRGRALAIIETSWAASAIIFIPIAGWLIDQWGWQSPFLILGLISLITSSIIWLRLPKVEPGSISNISWGNLLHLLLKPNVLAVTGVATLLFFAVTIFITIWGIWLNADFGLRGIQTGLVQSGIGVAEILGAGISSLFIDRIGKKRGSGIALLITSLLLLLLPLSQSFLFVAITVLITIGLFIEFAIVSLIPIYSEQVPEARGTVLALTIVGGAVGGTLGSPVATVLWETQGLWAVCLTASASLLATLAILLMFLVEIHPDAPSNILES